MKLNNKGFAITAILYALLILFSLSLVSVVAGLNSRNKILEKSIETIENKYNWECITEEKDPQLPNYTVTEKRGKYIFKYDNTDQKCISYIEKGE